MRPPVRGRGYGRLAASPCGGRGAGARPLRRRRYSGSTWSGREIRSAVGTVVYGTGALADAVAEGEAVPPAQAPAVDPVGGDREQPQELRAFGDRKASVPAEDGRSRTRLFPAVSHR
ncbi:hypothetical protein ACIP98_33150 [Streptomyces sp. NPDC088354]|uniref:hypothetical protein n=1 Tax=Streptomyces sp. NPDC088354 TaxID=3365856 RepID=UPI00381434D0